jgi:hypothetical protein
MVFMVNEITPVLVKLQSVIFIEQILNAMRRSFNPPVTICKDKSVLYIGDSRSKPNPLLPFIVFSEEDLRLGLTSRQWEHLFYFIKGIDHFSVLFRYYDSDFSHSMHQGVKDD